MANLTVQFRGRTHQLSLAGDARATVGELQSCIERELGVPRDTQRLFQKRRRLDCSDASRPLAAVCDCGGGATALYLVAGASKAQIEEMQHTQSAVQAEQDIRRNRRVVDISKRNEALEARSAASSNYRFHAIEPLPSFPDADRARSILEQLANDRGILAVMAKHKWSVGALAEMPPDGKVGVDPVCVLGLNQNKGQKILLRLRTDDLQGFRKLLSIKKVLFHELSHNVHSEHDSKFYQLMRQVEKECGELDWTNSQGATVGGARAMAEDWDSSESNEPDGRRLGGGVTGVSRLLDPIQPPAQSPTPTTPSVPPTPAPSIGQGSSSKDVETPSPVIEPSLEENKPDATVPAFAQAESSPVSSLSPEPKAVQDLEERAKTVDEEVAESAMSDRERRILQAARRLRTHHSAESVSKAVSLLHQIVSNIMAHPSDAKFRSIRKANRLFNGQVARFPECLEFLQALGFEDQAEKLVLVREDPALLWIGRSTLEVMLPASA